MLNFLRKGVKTLPAQILLGVLVISFAVWGIGDIFRLRLKEHVARVGDTEVPAQRFADALAREQSRLSRQTGQYISYQTIREAGLDRRVLAGLIRDAAFDEELRKLGISAPDKAVADAIRATPALQGPGGQFSNQAYSLFLAQQRMTPAEFEALNRTLLSQQVLSETVQAAAVAPPGAGARIAAFQGEQRKVDVLTLTPDLAPDPGLPDDGQLRTFYEANPAMFTEPERRWGEYIHVDAEQLAETLTPDEATLRAAYEANIQSYTVEERRTVDQITLPDRAAAEAAMARIAAGDATFETVATEFGQAGVDLSLGSVGSGDLPEAAAALVFGKAEPGIVGPVELPAGIAIYRVNDIQAGGAAPFEDVRDLIARRLANDAVRTRAPEIANQVDERRAEGLTMGEIAKRVSADGAGSGVAYGRFEGLARDSSLAGGSSATGVVASPTFVSEAFEALDAEERDQVETPDGGYLLIMVNRIAPSALLPLDQVRDRAIAAWQAAERLKSIEARAAEIAGGLGAERSIWDSGEELGVSVLPQGPFTRITPPQALPSALIDKIFSAGKNAGVSAVADDGSGVVIAQVDSITSLEPEAMATASEQVDGILADSIRADMMEYFARALEASHGARIEPGVIEDVFTRLGAVSQPGS